VVVTELDLIGIAVFKAEADAPLVIYRDRVLSATIAFERMQPIAGRDLQVVDPSGGIDLLQLAHSSCDHVRRHAFRFAGQVQLLRLRIGERLDHGE